MTGSCRGTDLASSLSSISSFHFPSALLHHLFLPFLWPRLSAAPSFLHFSSSCFSLLLSSVQGATIKRQEVSGEIFIARVIHGGLAERSGEPGLQLLPALLLRLLL